MTDEEIVARALRDHPEGLFIGPRELQRLISEDVARDVVDALREAGRIVESSAVRDGATSDESTTGEPCR